MLAKLHQTVVVGHAQVGIVSGKLATALYLHRSIRTVVELAQVIAAVEIHIRIAVRVRTCSRIVNLLLRVFQRLCRVIIGHRLVIERHILSRTQIFRVSLRCIDARIDGGSDAQWLHLTTLGSDEDYALSCLCTIEYYGRSALEHGNLLHLGGIDGAGLTGNSIYENKCTLSPNISVITTNERLKIIECIGAVVLFQQLFDIHLADTAHQVSLGNLTESHVYLGSVGHFLGACHTTGD